MQTYLGYDGLSAYKPPYANYIIKNYQIIVNILPEIRKEFNSTFCDARSLQEYVAILNETIMRYLGILDNQLKSNLRKFHNPILWLKEGIVYILIFPFILLNWFGIISKSIVINLTDNFLFKLISNIISLLSLLATIITIVIGWTSFFKTIKNLFGL